MAYKNLDISFLICNSYGATITTQKKGADDYAEKKGETRT
jgi:hypothetical protein